MKNYLNENFILNGSLTTTKAKCGNKDCKCHENKKYWHGPYTRWSGVFEGKRTTITLSGEQINECKKAMKNYSLLREDLENKINQTLVKIKNSPRD